MWKGYLRLTAVLIAIVLLMLPFTLLSGVALAGNSAEVVVTATGYICEAPGGFTIIYISDYELGLSWVKGEDAVNTMVRVKDGSTPTSRADGNLIYYGEETYASDTGLNFQESTGSRYYRAWSQNEAGVWEEAGATNFMENPNLTFIGLIIAAGIASFLAFKSRLPAMKFFGGLPWILLALYIRGNPPGNLTEGDSVHTAMWLIFVGFGLLIMFVGLGVKSVDRTETSKDFTEKSEGFSFGTPDFLKDKNSPEATRKRREEDNADYRAKAHNAVSPKARRSRRQ